MKPPTEAHRFLRGPADSIEAFHQRLTHFNHKRLVPAFPNSSWRMELEDGLKLSFDEGRFIEDERVAQRQRVGQAPQDPAAFMQWFEALGHDGPGQGDPLFPWLAERASREEMRWFLSQEVAGEAGFDDLLALTLLRMPVGPKLELARNFWDEMGRGKRVGMHGPMLELVVGELQLTPSTEATVWESLALGNLMAALAFNRRYAFQSIGALGVIEMTAPGRVSLVNAGLERLGVAPRGRRYFQLHAHLDIDHSREWNREVIRPLVAADPRCAGAIAEGALLRLRCGQRCFERYRKELGLPAIGIAEAGAATRDDSLAAAARQARHTQPEAITSPATERG